MVHTYRITISLPYAVYSNLKRHVGKGGVSQFIAEPVEKELVRREIDVVEKFIGLASETS